MPTQTTPSGPSDSGYITGYLLVATPAMPDERFRRTVIYMCRHDADGALGLVVNRTVEDMTEADLYKQLDISPAPGAEARPVILGGPVEVQRGFVLHSGDYKREETLSLADGQMGITGSLDIMRDLSAGTGPKQALLTLGHSGWGPGQLDRELIDNAWLVVPTDLDLVFGDDLQAKWGRALAKVDDRLGIDPGMMSHLSGRA
ncbi:MAG: YqgE/AlgH family protein [Alphaproteobacteria bacterium]|nr:YqgE/AlgH family protein [Alphaproteobacteria bacterium]MCW5741887.1 YqgE/AlgH family protein [Alphaproteobacteria bacterium]